MKNLTKATEFFFIPYILILAPSTYALLIWSKAEIHLWMNQYHSVFFDQFFKYLTNLGDGMTPVIIGSHSGNPFIFWLPTLAQACLHKY